MLIFFSYPQALYFIISCSQRWLIEKNYSTVTLLSLSLTHSLALVLPFSCSIPRCCRCCRVPASWDLWNGINFLISNSSWGCKNTFTAVFRVQPWRVSLDCALRLWLLLLSRSLSLSLDVVTRQWNLFLFIFGCRLMNFLWWFSHLVSAHDDNRVVSEKFIEMSLERFFSFFFQRILWLKFLIDFFLSFLLFFGVIVIYSPYGN